jgi:hypothetical protein
MVYALAILLGAAPIAFPVIRLVETGNDLRFVWMALASLASVALVMVLGRARVRTTTMVVALAALAFVVATLAGALVATLLGATSGPAVWLVASAFALCWAASRTLYAFARPRTVHG